ncbi:assimilatory nitrite reductase (NAD(P)H) small subunit [Alteribacillus persepolensis]|uniref:Assimilatory nitrite reductase (NAD(P)H) small subunit n=1 Tax=Alteribacillus persepolensis TaxID=568899 RepID=A0A1G8FJ60_9BACI|nr:nitrite reductase small subunit NirD [Alteribacillus persepolensis]SDH82160.1 assimilatory nitrite reductase (NAD(P)H) small subunit [Alteribacillus persepolensis]
MPTTKTEKQVFLCRVDDLIEGVPKEVMVNGESIAVFKTNKGHINALQNSCPHKKGPLSQGIVSGDHVFCPLHDWKISVKTGMVQEPDEGCVKTYPVEVKNKEVYLHFS